MNSKHLIDAIVRRTTVLIAQLSTAAGIRAPLAHVADQVFVELARELEAQGLGKKVVADMFGLALRGYQKRVQRLTASIGSRDRTLWEGVLEFVRDEREGVLRTRVLERFEHDGPEAVAAVLRDLVSTGLVFTAGQGGASMYRASTEAELRRAADVATDESLHALAWAVVFHHPGVDLPGLAQHLGVAPDLLRPVLERLLAEGRLSSADAKALSGLEATTLVVPVGAEQGWEGAVYDHFEALANALAAKVRLGAFKSAAADRIGGTTLHFEVCDGHPLEAEVYAQLAAVRESANDLWERVRARNHAHPIPEDGRVQVCFYFGQSVIGADVNGGAS